MKEMKELKSFILYEPVKFTKNDFMMLDDNEKYNYIQLITNWQEKARQKFVDLELSYFYLLRKYENLQKRIENLRSRMKPQNRIKLEMELYEEKKMLESVSRCNKTRRN